MVSGGDVRSGTVTVVFTDLVDSTALRQTLGDDDADALRPRHDAMIREACAAHGGTEVKSLGDGFEMSAMPEATSVVIRGGSPVCLIRSQSMESGGGEVTNAGQSRRGGAV